MNSPLRFTILAALVLAVVVLLAATLTTPVIYSLNEDTFSSRFHANTEALSRQQVNSSEAILPLMQELSGAAGPIVLNVRLDDPEGARRDLELFSKNRVAFDNLVVKLDMTESEMQEYAKNRRLQNQLLSELVNSSVSLGELRKLEVRYRDAKNPGSLMSVQLEGDALHERIAELYDRYDTVTNTTIATGKALGLDTLREEESVVRFREYVEETAPVVRAPVARSPAGTGLLTLVILPEEARYGDTVRCSGFFFSFLDEEAAGIPDRNVTVMVDDRPAESSMTGRDGGYAVRLTVDRLEAGLHTVQARSETTLSGEAILSVARADSVTTLYLASLSPEGVATVGGSVSAGVPVRNARVIILGNGTALAETATGADGWFETSVNLTPGAHALAARFPGNDLPLNPSESEPVEVSVAGSFLLPQEYAALLPAAAVVIPLVLVFAGAFWYLQRRRQRTVRRIAGDAGGAEPAAEETHKPPAPGDLPPGVPGGDMPAAATGSLFSRYARVLQDQGISEAAFAAYRDLSSRVAGDLRIREHTGLTPQELSRSCRRRPYCGSFARFVAVYETIRYGGLSSAPVRTEFEALLQHTEQDLGGGDPEE